MGSGGGQTSTQVQQQLAPEQREILNYISPILQQYANPETMPQPYGGPRVAGFNPAQLASQYMALNAAGGGVGEATGQALEGLNFFTSGAAMDPTRNPGLQGAIASVIDPLRTEYQTTVLPGIRDEANLTGNYGETRQGVAEGLASDAYMRAITQGAAQVVNPAYQAGLDATSRSLAFAPSVLSAGYQPANVVGAVGTQQQYQQQAEIDAQLRAFIESQYLPLMLAREIGGIAFGLPIGGTLTTSGGGGPSGAAAGLGGAASGAALGSAIYPGIGTGIGAVLGGLSGLLM